MTFKSSFPGSLFFFKNQIHIFWIQLHWMIILVFCKLNCNGQSSRNVVRIEHLSKKSNKKRVPETICGKSSWNWNDYNEFWSLPLEMCEWIQNLELPTGDAWIHTKLLNCLKPFISFIHTTERDKKRKVLAISLNYGRNTILCLKSVL